MKPIFLVLAFLWSVPCWAQNFTSPGAPITPLSFVPAEQPKRRTSFALPTISLLSPATEPKAKNSVRLVERLAAVRSAKQIELSDATLRAMLMFQPPTDILVHGGGNIQTAINSAVGGDTITLDVTSFTISASLNLPSHSGASYVTIRGAEDASIPSPALIRQPMASGVTVHMPVISTTNTNSDPVFSATTGGYWQIQGVMITDNATLPNGQAGFIYVSLTGGSHFLFDRVVIKPKNDPLTVAPYNTNARWAFRANATDITLQNSDLIGFYGTYPGCPGGAGCTTGNNNQDGGGILSDIGPGNPLVIQRNYVEAWFDHVLLGGTDPPATGTQTVSAGSTTTATVSATTGLTTGMAFALKMNWDTNYCKDDNTHPCWGNSVVSTIVGNNLTFPALVCNTSGGGARVACGNSVITGGSSEARWQGQTVSNVTIQQNHMVTPYTYSVWSLANSGQHPKAYIETKIVSTMLYDGNYLGGADRDGNLSFPNTMGTTSYNQSGGSPWTGVLNATYSNNWINSFNVAFFDPCADPYYINTPCVNLVVRNNLATNPDNCVGSPCSGSATSGVTNNWLEGKGGINISITHNSVLTGYPSAYIGAGTIKSQLADANYYSQPALTFRDNLWGFGAGMVCNDHQPSDCWPSYVEDHNLMALNVNPPDNNPATQFPSATSHTAANWAAVLFTNTCASVLTDCKLQAGSPGHNAASDGTDIGVNITTLAAALGSTSPSSSAKGGMTIKGGVTIH